jgi:hypothetical protein
LVIDYRKLNKNILKEQYPFPTIYHRIHELKDQKLFSTIDLHKGYYQLAITEKDKYKTTFATSIGLFEFNRMPFGISTGPQIFQRIISNIFEIVEDILIFYKDITSHVKNVLKILQKLNNLGISINYDKAIFFKGKIKIKNYY